MKHPCYNCINNKTNKPSYCIINKHHTVNMQEILKELNIWYKIAEASTNNCKIYPRDECLNRWLKIHNAPSDFGVISKKYQWKTKQNIKKDENFLRNKEKHVELYNINPPILKWMRASFLTDEEK